MIRQHKASTAHASETQCLECTAAGSGKVHAIPFSECSISDTNAEGTGETLCFAAPRYPAVGDSILTPGDPAASRQDRHAPHAPWNCLVTSTELLSRPLSQAGPLLSESAEGASSSETGSSFYTFSFFPFPSSASYPCPLFHMRHHGGPHVKGTSPDTLMAYYRC